MRGALWLVGRGLRAGWRWLAPRLAPAPGEAWLVWATVCLMLLGIAGRRLASRPPVIEMEPPAIDVQRFGRLDLNHADDEQLQTLPGIGPRLAARIVEHRRLHGPFLTIDALDAVSGIGPKTVARLRSLLVVRSDSLDSPR